MLTNLWARVSSINVPLVAAALFASAILHILVTMATPSLTLTSGYDRMVRDLPLNTMQVLPEVAPSTQILPFMAPDARYAVCRFDTAKGTVSLSGVLPEPGWLLALYSPAGDNFFTSSAVPGRLTDVSILIVPGDENWLTGAEAATAAVVTRDTSLSIPANRGLAVFRAPDRGEAYRTRQMAELKRARCQYRASPKR